MRDKAAVQILSCGAVAIGGPEPSFLTARARESPTFSLSDMEFSITPSSGRKRSSGHARFFFNEAEADLLEHGCKKIELEVKKFELSIEFQISQHQDNMRMRFLEMEQKLKDGNKNL